MHAHVHASKPIPKPAGPCSAVAVYTADKHVEVYDLPNFAINVQLRWRVPVLSDSDKKSSARVMVWSLDGIVLATGSDDKVVR